MAFPQAVKLNELAKLIGIEEDRGIKGYLNLVFLTIHSDTEKELTQKFIDYSINLLKNKKSIRYEKEGLREKKKVDILYRNYKKYPHCSI